MNGDRRATKETFLTYFTSSGHGHSCCQLKPLLLYALGKVQEHVLTRLSTVSIESNLTGFFALQTITIRIQRFGTDSRIQWFKMLF